MSIIKSLGNNKQKIEKLLGTKKQLRQVVSAEQLLINGEPAHTMDPLIIAFDKPAGWMSEGLGSFYNFKHFVYHQKMKKNFSMSELDEQHEQKVQIIEDEENDEEEDIDEANSLNEEAPLTLSYSVLDLLPKEYPLRRPGFHTIQPLSDDIGGLTIITQLYTLAKAFRSVRAPCKRVYRIQTRDKFTGLEDEAVLHFRSDIKDRLKRIINPPEFTVVDEKNNIADITIYDYKPDKIYEMLTAIRHQPLSIKRIGLGGLHLVDLPELIQPKVSETTGEIEYENLGKKKYWVPLDMDRINKLMSSKDDVVARLRAEKNKNEKRRTEELKKFIDDTNVSSQDFETTEAEKKKKEFDEETEVTEEILGVDHDYDVMEKPRTEKQPPQKLRKSTKPIYRGDLFEKEVELNESDFLELENWANEEKTKNVTTPSSSPKKTIRTKRKKY